MTENYKKSCSRCKTQKDIRIDFYVCKGHVRSECKKCTIKRNSTYQREKQPWKYRDVDINQSRAYTRAYYDKNRVKFGEYRRRFKEKHPGYYREYLQKKKNPKRQ